MVFISQIMATKEERLAFLIETGKYLKDLDKDIFKRIRVGTEITEIADYVDKKLVDDGYVSDPLSIEINQICNKACPLIPYKIKDEDKVSYSIMIIKKRGQKFKCPVAMANTKVLCRKYDRLLKNLSSSRIDTLAEVKADVPIQNFIRKVGEIFLNCNMYTLTNGCSFLIANLGNKKTMDENKIFPMHLDYRTKDKFVDGEVYFFDYIVTNLSHHDSYHLVQTAPFSFEIVKAKCNIREEKLRRIFEKILKRFQLRRRYSVRELARTVGSDADVNDVLYALMQYKVVIPYLSWKVEEDYDARHEKMEELEKIGTPEARKRVEELQDNSTRVFRFGHTVYVDKDGYKIIV